MVEEGTSMIPSMNENSPKVKVEEMKSFKICGLTLLLSNWRMTWQAGGAR